MTDAQIRFHQMVESKRHNIAQERNWAETLAETQRANREREAISRYANEVSIWSTKVQSETQKQVAHINAAASRYAADTNAATQRYISDQNAKVQQAVAQLNAAVSRYSTDVNAETQRYVTDQNVEASRYATDVNADTSRYRTDVESADRQARLAFDRTTQEVKNWAERQRVTLERIMTEANVKRTEAETSRALAQVRRLAAETEQQAQKLAMDAQRLKLDKEAAKYQNALNDARRTSEYAKANHTYVQIADKVWDWIEYIVKITS